MNRDRWRNQEIVKEIARIRIAQARGTATPNDLVALAQLLGLCTKRRREIWATAGRWQ